MKKIKSLLSVAIITFMTLAICAFNVSADTFSITVENTNTSVSIDGQTYTAYKVFSVTYDLSENAYTYSTDSSCLSSTGYGSYTPDTLNTTEQAQQFSTYIYENYIKTNNIGSAETAQATASGETAVITTPSAGYYAVFGTASSQGQSITSFVMLDTTNPNATVNPKLDAPAITKEIFHNDNSGSWGNVGDNQIGDLVKFRLISTVPNLNSYTNYTYEINDTLAAGFTLNQSSIDIKIGENGTSLVKDSDYTVNVSGNKMVIDVDVNKITNEGKVTAGDKLYTYYDATLNTSAKYTNAAVNTTDYNENTAFLKYSNNPYDTSSTANTPDSLVYDWTYEITVKKVDKNNNPLKGAGFKIINGSDELKLSKLSDNNYVVDTNGDVSEIITDSTGTFNIIGLDDTVQYTLTESTVPSGYKKCSDVKLNITSSYNTSGNELSTLNATFQNAESSNGLEVTIKNTSGSLLAETGGIGTKVFYVTGGILMAGAAILLVTKLRMKNKES